MMLNRWLENRGTEVLGPAFLEANAAGLLVIAGKEGGSVGAVTDGVKGFVVGGKSIEAILQRWRLCYWTAI